MIFRLLKESQYHFLKQFLEELSVLLQDILNGV